MQIFFVNFYNCRIPNQQLYLCKIFAKRRLNHISLFFLFSSLFGEIQQSHLEEAFEESALQKCRSRRAEVFCKNYLLKKFIKLIGKESLFFIKLEAESCSKALARVFSYEFWENFRDIYFIGYLLKMDILQSSCSSGYQANSSLKNISEEFQFK